MHARGDLTPYPYLQGNIENIRPYLPRNILADEQGFVRIASGRSVYSNKVFVIGESMDDRVIPFAKKIGAKWYKGWEQSPFDSDLSLQRNRRIINQKMKEGYTIIDIGHNPKLNAFPTRPNYIVELEEIGKQSYGKVIRVKID